MHSKENLLVLEQVATALQTGNRAAMATVVAVTGSAYRHEGARMAVFSDGSSYGSISGGCLEDDVRHAALEVLDTGVPRTLKYDMMADDDDVWGLGLGCNGVVEILIEAVD